MILSDVATTCVELQQQVAALAQTRPPNPWGQPQTIAAAIASVIAAFAYFNANAARNEVKISRRHERTDTHIEHFRSPLQRRKRDWVRSSLATFAAKEKLHVDCGLDAMRVGTPIRLKLSNGDTETLLGGEIAIDVLDHLDGIARDIRLGRLNNHAALQAMGAEMIETWRALAPYMPGRWSREYYRYTRGKWNIRSLVDTIEPHATTDEKLQAIRNRWGYLEA